MSPATAKKKSILLLEDDPNLGFILQEHLQMNGFEVTLHTNGEEGSKAVARRSFTLCLVDVMMPKKDGMTFVREFRQKDQTTPVIFLTARSLKEDRIEGFRVGADDYVTKPFSMEELLLRISAVLKRTDRSTAEVPTKAKRSSRLSIGRYVLDPVVQSLTHGKKVQTLTAKEAVVLEMLAGRLNEVVERDTLLENAWGDTSYHAGRSLDVFVSKMRKYFAAGSGIEILNVRGEGYKLVVKKNSR